MFSAVKQLSGLPQKGIALVSLRLFGNQWDQSDAACDSGAELRALGSSFRLCQVPAAWGWVDALGAGKDGPDGGNGNSGFPFSGSRFWPWKLFFCLVHSVSGFNSIQS